MPETTPTENKIKYGLKNCYASLVTQAESSGVISYTYATPVKLPGAVSLSLSAEGDKNVFYADDIAYYTTFDNNGYTGSLELAAVTDWIRTNLLGESKDSKNVAFEYSNGTEAPKFALLFEFQGDQRARKHVIYNCSCSRPDIEGKTKEETVEPQTETLSLVITPREKDNLVKGVTMADTDSTVYNSWYTSVHEPVSGSGGL